MTNSQTDRMLEVLGDRLFRRRRAADGLPTLAGLRPDAVRREVRATVRRAPQVMVKVTGGGRGMGAIKAHMDYISKRGRLEVEDQEGDLHKGKEAVKDLALEWRHAGTRIPDIGHRREAFNIILSMPRRTEGAVVQAAAREFLREELRGYRYAMVLHEHQQNPHVHVVVRAEGSDGRRLNPRKADLHRWRERFAAALRSYGIEAAASRRSVRGVTRRPDELWERVARREGRLRRERTAPGDEVMLSSNSETLRNWSEVIRVLARSPQQEDRELAAEVEQFVRSTPVFARRLSIPERRRASTSPGARDSVPDEGRTQNPDDRPR